MTITAVKTFSQEKMKKYLEDPNNFDFSWLKRYGKVWIMSIANPGEGIFKKENPSLATFSFHDIGAPSYNWLGKQKKQYQENVTHFNEAMAHKAVNFMLKAHLNDPNSKDLLLVNCQMGISRSGAFVTFAKNKFGLNEDKFKLMNPYIHPNQYVLSVLETVWQELGSRDYD